MAQGSLSHLWPGVPMAIASAVLFGASTPFSKLLLGSTDPQLLAGMLYLGAGLGLAGLRLGRHLVERPDHEAPIRRSDWPWLALIILFGGLLGPLLLMLGLARTSAASASLLLNLESLATMGVAWLVFRENVDRRLLLGAFAILTGAMATSWTGSGVTFDSGAGPIAAACIAWSLDNNLTRKLSSADPATLAMTKGMIAGAANTGLALLRGAPYPSASVLGSAVVIGFLGIGVSLVLFILALRHLGTARASAYFSLAPFVGAVLAILLLDEPLTRQLLLAGGLMSLGLWLHLAERHDHEHHHDGLRHEHAHLHDEHHRHAHDGPITEPHSHSHDHEPLTHRHVHYPDLHHRHTHRG